MQADASSRTFAALADPTRRAIRRGRRAQSRPCELDPAPLAQVVAWTLVWEHISSGGKRLRARLAVFATVALGGSRTASL